jgi:hypothetical protein
MLFYRLAANSNGPQCQRPYLVASPQTDVVNNADNCYSISIFKAAKRDFLILKDISVDCLQ